MRRVGNLFDAIADQENLRLAFCRAARGKRQRREVALFAAALDCRLADMATGLQRAAGFARRFSWRAHLDVRQCFDSIPHDRLRERLASRFKDARLRGLFAEIIAGFRGGTGRGLPIGNLMSQHFAIFYLGFLDRFVKERLRIRGYVRYMDDLVLWGDEGDRLEDAVRTCREFLADTLGLEFKPTAVRPSSQGLDVLGCRILPTHTLLSGRSRRRFRRRMRTLSPAFRLGLLDERGLRVRLEAATAFARGRRRTSPQAARSW
jgi:RNA-directed DNA polymerase